MLNDDRAAKKAEELLPCLCQNVREPRHHPDNTYCPAYNRPAVAAELRKAYAEIERLRNDLSDALDVKAGHGPTVLFDLKAEITRLKGKLNQKDDEYEQQCKHAEAEIEVLNKRIATEYVRGREHEQQARDTVHVPYIEHLKAEIARLRAELASVEQFAESWPCHCAENYPGATMYHGQDCQTAVAVEFVAQWRAAKVKP